MKRQGRVWIRIFPDVPVSKKPTEVRMGKGKGSVEYWAAQGQTRPGDVRDRRRGRGGGAGGAAPCGEAAGAISVARTRRRCALRAMKLPVL
jgi:hypothetical protein